MSQPEHQPKRFHRQQIISLISVLIIAAITIPLLVWWVTSNSQRDAVAPMVLEEGPTSTPAAGTTDTGTPTGATGTTTGTTTGTDTDTGLGTSPAGEGQTPAAAPGSDQTSVPEEGTAAPAQAPADTATGNLPAPDEGASPVLE
jgi:cytoskeletal protein RodZ